MNNTIKHIALFLVLCSAMLSFSQSNENLNDGKFDKQKWQRIKKSIRYEGYEQAPIDNDNFNRDFENGNGYGGNGSGNGSGNGNGSYGSGSGGSGSGAGSGPSSQDVPSTPDLPEVDPIDPPDLPDFSLPSANLGGFFKILGIILLLALIALIIYLIVKNSGSNKSVSTGSLDDINIQKVNPMEIPKTELELRLEKAMANEDYRECVRIYFIFTMKALVEKNYVRWKLDKTNFDYQQEVYEKPFYRNFSQTVSLFEIVWYGEREITREQFTVVEPELKNCIQSIE